MNRKYTRKYYRVIFTMHVILKNVGENTSISSVLLVAMSHKLHAQYARSVN